MSSSDAPPDGEQLARVAFEAERDAVVATVAGELDLSNAAAVTDEIDARAIDAGRLVIDLSRVEFMDVATIRALEHLAARRRGRRQAVALVAPPGTIAARLFGLIELSEGVEILSQRPA